jgi:hypothetical protein
MSTTYKAKTASYDAATAYHQALGEYFTAMKRRDQQASLKAAASKARQTARKYKDSLSELIVLLHTSEMNTHREEEIHRAQKLIELLDVEIMAISTE